MHHLKHLLGAFVILFALIACGRISDTVPMTTLATFTVSNTNDSGPGSLRQAILDANANSGADTITFSTSGTITLSSQLPAITDELTITGPAEGITISGNNAVRVFLIGNVTVRLEGLNIINGSTAGEYQKDGGAIFNNGTLTLSNSTLSGNSVEAYGGAIFNHGTLTLSNSTLVGNSVTLGGGGIFNNGTLTINNSTLVGNSAGFSGGGIFNNIIGILTISNSTLAGNSARFGGGGIDNIGSATLTLNNSIVALNIAALRPDIQSTSAISGSNNLIGGDPGLDPTGLQDNGGPTETIALVASSPAINAIPVGVNGCGTTVTTDQRGVSRPQGAGCDIGAFELEQSIPINTPPTADAGGPYTVAEGSSIQLDGSGSTDPDEGDSLSYEWDFDYDGTTFDTDATGVSPTFSAADIDGPTTVTVALRVTDVEGAEDTATAVVTVENVAPTITSFSLSKGTIIVGQSITATGAFTDPAPADTHTATFDWDDGDTTTVDPATSPVSDSHTYLQSGSYSVELTVSDDDGGSDSETASLQVLSPAQATQQLINTVNGLNLAKNTEKSLLALLKNALNSIERDNSSAAIGQLNAFINQVEAQAGKKISQPNASLLIGTAQAILYALENDLN